MSEKFLYHEWAGLGYLPPYKFLGLTKGRTSCDACGTRITYIYQCKDQNDRLFVLGCECIKKLDCAYLTTQAELALKDLKRQEKEIKKIERVAKKNQELAEKRRQEELTREQRKKDNLAEIRAKNPDLVELIDFSLSDKAPPFAQSVMETIALKGNITENQLSALQKTHKKYLLSLTPKALCPAGEEKIEGEIVSIKSQQYGWQSTLKMVIQDKRGFRVYGTVPQSIQGESLIGMQVSLTAFIEPSEKDTSFGFYYRPKKASLVF